MHAFAARTLALMAALSVTGAATAQKPASLEPSFSVTSPTYKEFAFIDRRHGSSQRDCGGQDISPALAWNGEPDSTKSFAVTYYDPDGNNGQGEAHWIGYNIPTTVHALAEGAMSGSTPGMTVGVDDHGKQEYFGPCPPYGKFHHYVFGVYALDIPVGELPAGMKRADLLKAIYGHVRAYQSIVFVFQRTPPAGWTPPSGGTPPKPSAGRTPPPKATNGQ